MGLVRRNTGYGHPLRPEYLLEPRAATLASICGAVHGKVEAWQAQDLAYRKWSLPLVLATGLAERRFADFRQQLAPITARALAIGLKDLEQHRWLSRSVGDQYPPETRYALGQPGRILHRIVVSGGAASPAQANCA